MTTGCVITHKYYHHGTLLGYMGVGSVWDKWLFDYRMTNKLISIHQTLVQPCVPTANDEIPWDAGHWTHEEDGWARQNMIEKDYKVFEMYLNCIWNIKYFLNVFKYKYKYFSFWKVQIQIQIQILEKKYWNTFKYKYSYGDVSKLIFSTKARWIYILTWCFPLIVLITCKKVDFIESL